MTTVASLPRAILFDWDNTLVDNWRAIHAALNVTLDAMGQAAWSYQETRARVRQSMRDSFPRQFGDRWEEARDIFYGHFRASHLSLLQPMPGAEALLGALADRGIYQAVVSNKTGTFLRAEAQALGWQRYFGRIIGASDARADKPDPAPVALALEPVGIRPGSPEIGDTWFVGDADIDMECAHATGCLPVLVGAAEGDQGGLERFPPALRFESCVALYSLVQGTCDTISLVDFSGPA